MKQTLISFGLILICCCSYAVEGQTKKIAQTDKAQIIKIILKKYNFRANYADWKDNEVNTIYLFIGNISPKQIPHIKGVKFIFVTRKEIDKLDKTVTEYYEFGKFRVGRKSVRIDFSMLYLHPVNGDGTLTQYKCRKIAGKWKVKELNQIDFADSHPFRNTR